MDEEKKYTKLKMPDGKIMNSPREFQEIFDSLIRDPKFVIKYLKNNGGSFASRARNFYGPGYPELVFNKFSALLLEELERENFDDYKFRTYASGLGHVSYTDPERAEKLYAFLDKLKKAIDKKGLGEKGRVKEALERILDGLPPLIQESSSRGAEEKKEFLKTISPRHDRITEHSNLIHHFYYPRGIGWRPLLSALFAVFFLTAPWIFGSGTDAAGDAAGAVLAVPEANVVTEYRFLIYFVTFLGALVLSFVAMAFLEYGLGYDLWGEDYFLGLSLFMFLPALLITWVFKGAGEKALYPAVYFAYSAIYYMKNAVHAAHQAIPYALYAIAGVLLLLTLYLGRYIPRAIQEDVAGDWENIQKFAQERGQK